MAQIGSSIGHGTAPNERALRRKIAYACLLLLPWMLIFSRTGAEIATALVGLLFLWRSAEQRDWQWLRAPAVRMALVAWLWLMVGVSTSALHPQQSFLLALPWIRYILLFVAMRYWLLTSRQALVTLGVSLTGMLSFCAIDTIWQYAHGVSLTGRPIWPSGRLSGPMTSPRIGIFMAKFLLPTLAVLALVFAHRPKCMVPLLLLLGMVCSAAVLLTGERSAFIMLSVASGLGLLVIAWRHRAVRRYVVGMAAIFVAATLLIFSTQSWVQHSLDRTLNNLRHFATSPYGEVFQGAVDVGQRYWLTGTGIHGFRYALPQLREQNGEPKPSEGFMHVHHPYLEWFAEAGVIGLLLWCGLLWALLREALQLLRAQQGITVIAPAVMLAAWVMDFFPFMVSQSYFLNWSGIMLWYTLGVAFSLRNQVDGAPAPLHLPVKYALKRAMDIAGALGALVLLSPLLLWAAVMVACTMGRPIFFRQVRPGLDQQPFSILKFRTMRNATDRHGKPLSDAERLTGFGARMRDFSIDELPQLINILKGEMSFVGPRPLLYEFFPYYTPDEMRRHEMKPGISGWAQIHGRNNLNWDKRLAMDVWYIDHWNLWLDIVIIFRTVLTVIRREGVNTEGHVTFLRLDEYRRDKVVSESA